MIFSEIWQACPAPACAAAAAPSSDQFLPRLGDSIGVEMLNLPTCNVMVLRLQYFPQLKQSTWIGGRICKSWQHSGREFAGRPWGRVRGSPQNLSWLRREIGECSSFCAAWYCQTPGGVESEKSPRVWWRHENLWMLQVLCSVKLSDALWGRIKEHRSSDFARTRGNQ